MHSTMIQQAGSSAGGPARAPSAAEMQAIDAQLELAAKKAALEGMKRASGDAQAADAPEAPAMPSRGGVITIEKDGKTITLDNPTAEQLAAVTGTQSAPPSGWQLVSLTGAVVWGIVAVIWMFLSHRRRVMGVSGVASSAPSMDARMARIENAIESVAVEVERISEGQRYTSRMLSEGAAQPVNGGASVPENVGAVLQNRGGG